MEHPENSKEYKGLTVNSGVEQPSNINPYLKRGRYKHRRLSVNDYVEGIVKGDVTVLGQAVTLVESTNPEHQVQAQEVIEKCLPYSGRSIRVGISGVPGAGKSTSIDEFGLYVLKEHGGKLAVLAIDPSSERSKGSILGDKTRMEKLAVHPDSFIRPSPSAGSLGGVARKTRESIILCEAAGFDKIFVETVGVGQSETACHSMVDFFLLIQLAGTGDELQGIKRGIMEMADGIVINKCDGNNVDNTAELEEGEEKQQSATITVLASPEQAEVITGIENDGTAHVALICRNNEELAAELLQRQDQEIQELYYGILPEEQMEAAGETMETAEPSGENTAEISADEDGAAEEAEVE